VTSSIRRRLAPAAVAGLVLALAAVLAAPLGASAASSAPAAVTVFASGLQNPRGLAFGPDGNLYVAEAGRGGTQQTTPAMCTQVPAPLGPYSGGLTSRISRISPSGVRSTVVSGLPSASTTPATGGDVLGVAAVTFFGGKLYALESGAGCSHGLNGTVNALLRVNLKTGFTTTVANLSAFLAANPVAHPNASDFEPDGTWYSMVVAHGAIYAVEPNHGEVDRINPFTGSVKRVLDFSAGHPVPTSISFDGSKFFFGNLGEFPIAPGFESIWRMGANGSLTKVATGLTTVLATAFDASGRLFALESMTAPGFPGPAQLDTGKVVRVGDDGSQTTVVDGLSFPTAMTFGPDGALYISNFGLGAPTGEILRATLPG
jgi:hypothetical protein